MPAYALLLRGVNVGGRGVLAMSTLRDALTSLGYSDVQTYLQSGNAVLRSAEPANRIVERTQQALQEATGRGIAVVIRSAAQLRRTVERWPFDAAAPATSKHVTFLRSAAAAAALAAASSADFAPEQMAVSGGDVYLFLPRGLGRSKLMPALSRALKDAVATTRNWNTVAALDALLRSG